MEMLSKHVYLDNAATTPMDPKVIEAMNQVMLEVYGNPSATHALGRKAKGVIESARKSIASLIGAQSKEIIFTSGGTEADNLAIRCAVRDLGIRSIITSPIEHKAVLSTSQEMESDAVSVHLVRVDDKGRVDYAHLNELAEANPHSLISLMHANNEIGTLLDYHQVAEIASSNNCLFHSDTVQTMGHYPIHVADFKADFLTCSAHKFCGPKGIGFLYVNSNLRIKPMITGGGQERSLRAGTENITGITGLQKAMELCWENMDEEIQQITALKNYMRDTLLQEVPGIEVNGETDINRSLYTVLSVSLPPTDHNDLLLFQLDMAGVCASGGSACNSGAAKGSHVLEAIGHPTDRQTIRFSFGRFSTREEVDIAVSAVKKILSVEQPV